MSFQSRGQDASAYTIFHLFLLYCRATPNVAKLNLPRLLEGSCGLETIVIQVIASRSL